MTNDVRLRPLTVDDAEAAWQWAADPEFTRYLTWQPYTDNRQLVDHLARASTLTEFPDQMWGVMVGTDLVGSIHAIMRDEVHAQFGYGVRRPSWGQGIGTLAARLALAEVTARWCACTTLWADVHIDNSRGAAVARRLGFIREGLSPDRARERYVLRLREGFG